MAKKFTPIILFISIILGTSFITGLETLAAKKTARENTFSLNFNDVEISDFLNVMSQILEKNIIISDKVKGKITISSARRSLLTRPLT